MPENNVSFPSYLCLNKLIHEFSQPVLGEFKKIQSIFKFKTNIKSFRLSFVFGSAFDLAKIWVGKS